jgi:hypothetical protein
MNIFVILYKDPCQVMQIFQIKYTKKKQLYSFNTLYYKYNYLPNSKITKKMF